MVSFNRRDRFLRVNNKFCISNYHFDTDYKYVPKYYLDGDEYKETTDELMLKWLGLDKGDGVDLNIASFGLPGCTV